MPVAFDAITLSIEAPATFFDFIVDLTANTFRMVGEAEGLPIDQTRTLGIAPIITIANLATFITSVSFDSVQADAVSAPIGALSSTRMEEQTVSVASGGPTTGVMTAI